MGFIPTPVAMELAYGAARKFRLAGGKKLLW
jgi:hypothetical protein